MTDQLSQPTTDPDIEAACEDITKGLKTHRGCSPGTDGLRLVYDALVQAQDCIRGETPEDVTDAEAREDTINKVRDAMRAIEAMQAGGVAQAARVPKVRTSHHRNKEEAARLQELVAKRYTAREITSVSDFVRRLRQYNAAHLAYEMSHDEAVDALLLLFGHTHLVSSTHSEGGK
jgi:hypothetical protein